MIWNDWVIFPQLGRTDKVRVSTDPGGPGQYSGPERQSFGG